MSTDGIGKSYDEFLQSIKARGLGTTALGNGEANFADYANALSSDLKEELLQSVGDEAGDAQLQSKVASLFGGKSVMQSNEIISAARSAGLQCSVEYRSTSYIVDNKFDGHYDKDVTNGSIAIYTFSDGNSTIKIADANGNGALEAEEIFLNEILGDVTNSIGVSSAGNGAQATQDGPSALDVAKMQQNLLLEQIQKSRANQEEAVEKLEESRQKTQELIDSANEDGSKVKKKDENEEENSISQAKFEKLVFEEALSGYSGNGRPSIEAIEKAADKIKSEYNVDYELSAQDAIALSKDYARETDKIDSSNGEENLFEKDILEEEEEI